MTTLTVSVVVVSRDRPDELRKCLKALQHQTHNNFEVVVVADPVAVKSLSSLNLSGQIKIATFDQPNVSAARNVGIRHAAGEIVAFIDDDAVAEPTWLERLTRPFADPGVAATGGFVKGRNGISLQWGAEIVDANGDAKQIDLKESEPIDVPVGHAVKTPGTNCAFCRRELISIGGFDEFYRFFLDETDVNVRLAKKGALTLLVPSAEVQHGFVPSALRRTDRAPRSLTQIGRSKGYFLQKFGRPHESSAPFRRQQFDRLIWHMVRGGLEPRDVNRLMAELDEGFDFGWSADIPAAQNLGDELPTFLKFGTFPHADKILKGRWIQRSELFDHATELARHGVTVTVFAFSPTTLFHHRWFHENGFWVQTGGKYGKSHRSDPLFRRYQMETRVDRELDDLRNIRHPTL